MVKDMAAQLGVRQMPELYWYSLFALRYSLAPEWEVIVKQDTRFYVHLPSDRMQIVHPMIRPELSTESYYGWRGMGSPKGRGVWEHIASLKCPVVFALFWMVHGHFLRRWHMSSSEVVAQSGGFGGERASWWFVSIIRDAPAIFGGGFTVKLCSSNPGKGDLSHFVFQRCLSLLNPAISRGKGQHGFHEADHA
ncbi:unnamed protein product [Effrenium voratum]|uniref:Uncharacterized protein n=1 Tax=Effrenium voratum TaxID=2562239 RepID=A0AA36HR33_9DINO|nr:unnamed protein product [Effrenium voratum]CAJ1445990.1 unnamed protein product [Effrenium voratum]